MAGLHLTSSKAASASTKSAQINDKAAAASPNPEQAKKREARRGCRGGRKRSKSTKTDDEPQPRGPPAAEEKHDYPTPIDVDASDPTGEGNVEEGHVEQALSGVPGSEKNDGHASGGTGASGEDTDEPVPVNAAAPGPGPGDEPPSDPSPNDNSSGLIPHVDGAQKRQKKDRRRQRRRRGNDKRHHNRHAKKKGAAWCDRLVRDKKKKHDINTLQYRPPYLTAAMPEYCSRTRWKTDVRRMCPLENL